MTASTSSSPSAKRIRTRSGEPTPSSPKSFSPISACWRSIRRRRKKRAVNTLVGRTVTLELKPEQAETLARARQSGTLALALRSITDVNATAEGQSEDQVKRRSESVNVVRYGVANQTTAQK